jgi:hypothetical protein
MGWQEHLLRVAPFVDPREDPVSRAGIAAISQEDDGIA